MTEDKRRSTFRHFSHAVDYPNIHNYVNHTRANIGVFR